MSKGQKSLKFLLNNKEIFSSNVISSENSTHPQVWSL